MQNLSIIIPTCNEEGNIGRLIERINTTLYYRNIPYEIIVVDDGSCDGTCDVARKYAVEKGVGDELRVLRFDKNRGKGGAVKYVSIFLIFCNKN